MLEKKFNITQEDIIRANEKLIKKKTFEKNQPITSKIINYFSKPKKYQTQIGESEKTIPNFYTDFLGYKTKKIKFQVEELNEAWKQACEKNKL